MKKKELCVSLVIYKNYIEIHSQQNIKFYNLHIIIYCQYIKDP